MTFRSKHVANSKNKYFCNKNVIGLTALFFDISSHLIFTLLSISAFNTLKSEIRLNNVKIPFLLHSEYYKDQHVNTA